jgi:type IV secretory pathway VirB4 component
MKPNSSRTTPTRRRIRRPRRPAPTAPPNRAAAFTPDAISVGTRHLEVGGEHVASFAITGYPREVYAGWLQPLLTYPGRLDVSLHIDPVDPATAAARLKKQLAKLESGRRYTSDKGRLIDPQVEAATEDAYALADRIARGEGRLFRLGLYLTVHATDADELAREATAVRALAASLLLDAKPATYRSMQGWASALPLGLDLLGMKRTFDTAALSSAFPFTSPDLPAADPTSVSAPEGVLYGFNLGSQSLVHWDRFALDNHNSVILGRSGAGKSYLVKLEALRSLYRGVEIIIIDPEDEYRRLCHAVGGRYLNLGDSHVRLNPFDIPIHTAPDGRRTAARDALIHRSLFLHTVVSLLVGKELSGDDRAVLDRAISTTYQQAGITSDPRTWTRPTPILADLVGTLQAGAEPAGIKLADRLQPYVAGAFRYLFDGQTTTRPDGHLVVFSLRDLADELKPVGTLLTLDAAWRRVTNPAIRRPRMIVVDEAGLFMQQRAAAEFLFRLAKSFRKYWGGLTLCTQDHLDLLSTDLGKAIIANSATQILLRQAPQPIDDIVRVFTLSAGERQFLLCAERGQGLLSTGTQRVAFQSLASPAEDRLITTSPEFLATLEDSEPNSGWFEL